MPMPLWWGHINKRTFNPREISGGKRPVLTHVGRATGTVYHTPLDAHPVEGGYLFILVYGAKSDWVQNVMAATHARLRIDGQEVELVRPRIVGEEHLPAGVAPPPRFLRISEYLRMDTAEG